MVATPNWPVLSKGQSGTNVRALQLLLRYRGECISIDGGFGDNTYNAVLNFQKKNGLRYQDGIAGQDTLSALVTTISSRTTNDAAWAAQTLLAKFESLAVDSDFYTGSETATKNFQTKMGFAATNITGTVTPLTWRYLFGYDKYPSSSGGDVFGDYITAGTNGWLKLYKAPTSTKVGRTVSIPSVASFTGSDGKSYSFNKRTYWYAYENPYGTNRLNPYAISRIKAVTGAAPVVKVGSNGEFTDEKGNYWMAVGPKVPYPSQASGSNIDPNNMYALGKLDVVVKDNNGTRYYIPGVIGDIKAHTWDNGVIQTFKAYPNGKFESAGASFNGTVCAEFIGALSGKLSGLSNYSVEKIIFYAD